MDKDFKVEVFVNGVKMAEGKAIAGIVLCGSESDSEKSICRMGELCYGNLTEPEWASIRYTIINSLLTQEGLGNPVVKALADMRIKNYECN